MYFILNRLFIYCIVFFALLSVINANANEQDNKNLLIHAIDSNNVESVQSLLDSCINTEIKIHDGYTPLMECVAKNKDIKIIKALLSAKANMQVRDESGWTLLMLALFSKPNAKETVDLLLSHGAPVDEGTHGYTPLMVAAEFNSNPFFLQRLLAAGAAINAVDENGKTALMYAAAHNTSLHVAVLLSAGADPSIRDAKGLSAFNYAQLRFAEQSRRSHPQAKSEQTKPSFALRTTSLMWAAYRGDDIQLIAAMLADTRGVDAVNAEGKTALMMAANEKTMQALLLRGANINAQDKAGKTALMYHLSDKRLCTFLLDCGADASLLDREGKSALIHSVDYARESSPLNRGIMHSALTNKPITPEPIQDSFDVLLAAKVDVNVRSHNGMTALTRAIERNNSRVVQLLLQSGASVSGTVDGKPLLMMAVLKRDIAPNRGFLSISAENRRKIIDLLLDFGCDASADVNGYTVLMAASKNISDSAVVTRLIRHGASVNASDPSGKTALIYAASSNNVDVVKALLDAGADPKACDKQGLDAIQHALLRGKNVLSSKKGNEKDHQDELRSVVESIDLLYAKQR